MLVLRFSCLEPTSDPFLVESTWSILQERILGEDEGFASFCTPWLDQKEGFPEFLRQATPPPGVRPGDFKVSFREGISGHQLVVVCSPILLQPHSDLAEEHLTEILAQTEAARHPFVDAEEIQMREEAKAFLALSDEERARVREKIRPSEVFRFLRIEEMVVEEELSQAIGTDVGPSLQEFLGQIETSMDPEILEAETQVGEWKSGREVEPPSQYVVSRRDCRRQNRTRS